MRILYLTDKYMDYLADEVLYGLRFLLGPDVVDYPQKEILYRSLRQTVDPVMVWANGATAFGLPDLEVDRDDIEKKIRTGFFDLIINSNCWRINSPVYDRMTALDGEDHSLLNPKYFGRVLAYYKRELVVKRSAARPIQLSLPDHLLDLSEPDKTKLVHASFSVYPGIRSRLASLFPCTEINNWHEYIIDIKKSWFGISPKGAGYDCQRHYEILGNAVLCIYLDSKAPSVLRESFIDGENCIVFSDADELKRKLDSCNDPAFLLERGRESLLTRHLSSSRAKMILDDFTCVAGVRRTFPLYSVICHGIIPLYKRKLSCFIGEKRNKLGLLK